MNKCEKIEEMLVDRSDGLLNEKDKAIVQEHLTGCASCRETLEYLNDSLGAMQTIWQDTLVQPQTFTPRGYIKRIIAAAALIAIAAGLWQAMPKPVTSNTGETKQIVLTAAQEKQLMEELELDLRRAESASRMMSMAEINARDPYMRKFAIDKYEFVIRNFPELEQAKTAKVKLAKLLNNKQKEI